MERLLPDIVLAKKDAMDKATFKRLQRIVYEKSGIALSDNKDALVSARVNKRLRALGIPDPQTYLKYVLKDETGEEIVNLLDVISTNVTGFFREQHHFVFLSKAVSEWRAEGQRAFRFWSAGSSTGEEAYSIAMTVLEALDGVRCETRILATDISTRVLEEARAGSYDSSRMKDVPRPLQLRYFEPDGDSQDRCLRAKPVLRKTIVFRRLNLASPPFPMRGPFDAVFCRNVMIYFDDAVRRRLLGEVYRLLRPGGYLMVGHAESLISYDTNFKPVRPSTYVKE
jgi:chemotaxis protein methyltransferase CheR